MQQDVTLSPSAERQTAQPSLVRRLLWPDWERRKRMLRREAWLVALAAYPLLAFAYLWPQDWRNEGETYVLVSWAAFAVRVLQFHLGLLLLVIVAAAAMKWRTTGRRLALAALPPMLFILVPAAAQFAPKVRGTGGGATTAPALPPPALRVMSVNLLMVNTDTAGIIGEIKAERPDVLMLQEYTAGWHDAIRRELGGDYPHASVVMREDSFGIALYSRTPFAGEVEQRFPLGRAGVEQMRAEIDLRRGHRVALYNVHLLPPRTPLYTSEHRLQFADMVDALKAESLPYVVCGDFNFPETAPQHAALKRIGAREAHELAGHGRGATWPVNGVFRYVVPGIRIDHVYLAPALTATRCQTGIGRGSDHRPVVVDVALRNGTW
jgi:endonuclease/exonuclease/phosphatase (EEP) superfamily protein YafD